MTSFRCQTCGEMHSGVPLVWGPDAPDRLRSEVLTPTHRALLTSDICVIARSTFFVRACLDLPIVAEASSFFRWLVWVELERASYRELRSMWRVLRRRAFAPLAGKLANALPYEAPTRDLAVELHDRGPGIRPSVLVLDPLHELGREQAAGISLEKAYELAGRAMHRQPRPVA
ncbi:MAG: DUF2199 domain-containing protein [Gemmatimonadaceae bacterium]